MRVEGSIKDYLGIGIDKLPYSQGGGFKLHQSGIIETVLKNHSKDVFQWQYYPNW